MHWKKLYYYNVRMLNFKINVSHLNPGDLVIGKLSTAFWKKKNIHCLKKLTILSCFKKCLIWKTFVSKLIQKDFKSIYLAFTSASCVSMSIVMNEFGTKSQRNAFYRTKNEIFWKKDGSYFVSSKNKYRVRDWYESWRGLWC